MSEKSILPLPDVIPSMYRKQQLLGRKEQFALEALRTSLAISPRETKRPFVVGMIGLVGSGKSRTAQLLAHHSRGTTVISANAVRLELRKQGEECGQVRAIVEWLALYVFQQGGNVIIDYDFVDAHERTSLFHMAKEVGARVSFIRTYCDFAPMLEIASLTTDPAERIVMIRDMMHRLPHHYRWLSEGGGTWRLRQFRYTTLAQLDTNSPSWERSVAECAEKLLGLCRRR